MSNEIDVFATNFIEEIKKYIEPDQKVQYNKVNKNNGVKLVGVTITGAQNDMTPNIYIEQFYQRYCDGEPIAELAQELVKIHEAYSKSPRIQFNAGDYTNFTKAKHRIVYKLINRDMNEELLQRAPHFSYMDLEMVFYYLIDESEEDNASILVLNAHMEMWDISDIELLECARVNTPKLLPYQVIEMLDMLKKLAKNQSDKMLADMDLDVNMYILTNVKKYYGASCICYPNVLEECSKIMGGNFYLLPSSIHEFILIEDNGEQDEEYINDMIQNVNETQLDVMDVLSNHAYYYDAKDMHLFSIHN